MTKTCKECKHCANKQIIATCEHRGIVTGDAPAAHCRWFAKQIPTYGDLYRQYSNREIAELMALHCMCDFCPAETESCEHGNNFKECRKAWQRWLDLPAESEGEDE